MRRCELIYYFISIIQNKRLTSSNSVGMMSEHRDEYYPNILCRDEKKKKTLVGLENNFPTSNFVMEYFVILIVTDGSNANTQSYWMGFSLKRNILSHLSKGYLFMVSLVLLLCS